MYEKMKKPEERQFSAYLDLLPTGCREFPFLFNERELPYLNGSPLKEELET